MRLTAEQAACSIYGLEVSLENCTLAMKLLHDAGLEPVTIANGDPALAVAVSTKKVNMEPWRFSRLVSTDNQAADSKTTVSNFPQNLAVNTDEQAGESSSENSQYCISIAPCRSSIIDLCKQIMPLHPIPTLTESLFLTEEEVFMIVKLYLPDGDLSPTDLYEWMSKDGGWGPTKRKQINKQRKSGRWYNVVHKEFRDFTWGDISNIQRFRLNVKSTKPSTCTIGYARKSNTKEPIAAKIKSINLQIYKLRKKLLCEEVFVSINTSSTDPILSRDHEKLHHLSQRFVGCSGDSQAMINFITETNRKVRLVVIDFAGLSTNVDDLRHFIKSNKSITEVSVDEGHKVNVYTRHELLHNDDIIRKFNCRQGPIKRSLNV